MVCYRNTKSMSNVYVHLFARRIGTFFIWFRHIAIDFVTISLGLNRGSHYELVHTCLTKRTTVWLGSYNRQRVFNFGRGFSIVKVECPLSIIWTKSNCGALPHSSVPLSKKTARFQTNMRVTKSIAMCQIEMKRCRFGVQNGVLMLWLSHLNWQFQLHIWSRQMCSLTFMFCEECVELSLTMDWYCCHCRRLLYTSSYTLSTIDRWHI